ncbi:bcl-2 homologous antagonist/killer isoform X1 [Orcinus orca]|uniref:bcl-2 homologous antagonist/killer isoform X1 n=1 Tax=Orcinus orca TaxID=9733 RepID=UPI00062BA853|nr:bcl-2 homologous antagonist/killer isoform X1 [Orcinus orca]
MFRELEAHVGSPCRSWELDRPGGFSHCCSFFMWVPTPIRDLAPFSAHACPLSLGPALVSENTVGTAKEGGPRLGHLGEEPFAMSPGLSSPAAYRSLSTMGQVGRQLAIIGDDINRRYDSEFQAMLQHLQPTAENAYEYFTKIASSLFESGINWGRVVALLGFGYRLALHVYQRGLTGFLGQVTRFVADFMLHHCIARWIAQRGGWVAALDLGNGPIRNVLIGLAVVLLGQFVLRRFFKS